MRRGTLRLGIGTLLLITLLCGSVAIHGWLTQSNKLVMGGARNVQIARRGLSQLHLSYRLPDGQRIRDLRDFLTRQGWRRISLPNSERLTLSFVRTGWPQAIREILVITLDPEHRDMVDMQFGRCFVSTRVDCF